MKKNNIVQRLTGQLLLVVSLLAGLVSYVAAASLEFNPKSIQLEAGETALIEVIAKDIPASGLAAFQFDLQFDSNIINITDPNVAYVPHVPSYVPLGNNPFCAVVRGVPNCSDSDWMLILTGRIALGTISNEMSKLSILYATSVDNTTLDENIPPTGTGVIALLKVVAVGDGKISLEFSNTILTDNGNPPLEHSITTTPLSVQVGQDNSGLPAIISYLLMM